MNFRSLTSRGLVATLALLLGAQAFAARTTTYFHNDGLGSAVAATNDAGAVLWRKSYAPFGAQLDTPPVPERTSYTGKQHDDLTGLTYFGGRNFDPELGRFVSVDPVAFTEANTMSFNRYLYVNNNPYKYVDPDGEFLNFAAKFILDGAINVALNYVTTGEMNIGGALKETAIGLINPIPGKNFGKLVLAMKKADKVAPDPRVAMASSESVKNLGGKLDDAANKARNQQHRVDTVSEHAKGRMISRDVSMDSVQEALKKGKSTFDPKTGKGNYQLPAGESSTGRAVQVIRKDITRNIVTVIDKGTKK